MPPLSKAPRSGPLRLCAHCEERAPVREYVAAVRDAGYDGPWGVEVLSEKLRALPIEVIFDRAYLTSSAQLAR